MKTLKKSLLSLMMLSMTALCIGQWAMAGGNTCPPNSCFALCEYEAKPIGTCYINGVPHELHRANCGYSFCYEP